MAKISRPKRTRLRGRYPDQSPWAQLVKDDRVHVDIGVVHAPDGASHFRVEGGDVLVEVETMRGRLDLTCRLGAGASGVGCGLWRVPAVGEEVLVLVPDGDATFMPCILASLSNNAAPARVSDQRTILVATDAIEIQAPKTSIGDAPGSATEPLVLGNQLVSLLNSILDKLATHTHPVAGIVAGTAATVAAISTEMTDLKATEAPQLSQKLSDVAFTQKGGG